MDAKKSTVTRRVRGGMELREHLLRDTVKPSSPAQSTPVPRAVVLRRELAEDVVAVAVHRGRMRLEDRGLATLAHPVAELLEDVLVADGGVAGDLFEGARGRAVAAVRPGLARVAERVRVVDADVTRRVCGRGGQSALADGETGPEGLGPRWEERERWGMGDSQPEYRVSTSSVSLLTISSGPPASGLVQGFGPRFFGTLVLVPFGHAIGNGSTSSMSKNMSPTLSALDDEETGR